MTRTTPEDSDSNSDTETEGNMRSTRGRTKDHIEQLELLIHLFFEAIRKPWFNIKRIATYLMVDRGGYKALDETVQWLVQNPFTSLALFVFLVMSLPFLLFIGFGICVVALTFTGFIVLEGTLLTFVSVLSFGCLGALFVVLTIIAAVALSVYMGFSHIYDIYGSGKINALLNILKGEHDSGVAEGHNRTGQGTSVQEAEQNIDTVGSSAS